MILSTPAFVNGLVKKESISEAFVELAKSCV